MADRPMVMLSPSIPLRNGTSMSSAMSAQGGRDTFRAPESRGHSRGGSAGGVYDGPIIGRRRRYIDHGVPLNREGRSTGIASEPRDTDAVYAQLTADGAPSLTPPHDFLGGRLRVF